MASRNKEGNTELDNPIVEDIPTRRSKLLKSQNTKVDENN